ncbi:multidrug transporter [Natronobeatus ordinarius]|uniref:multidrug transporter n=1 Tax=Natronobeatus ordinarius TaxID=2963433 RepID=UPI0020CFB34B|nr:multidrug transporter [Natronobeatus ordinarius]
MTVLLHRSASRLGTAVGILAVAVAIVGTRFFGWEWGATDQLAPLVVGIVAAVAAGIVVLRAIGN